MDSTITYVDVDPADDKKKRFSFNAFEFPSQKGETVYLHAVLQVCTGTDADK